MIEFGNRCELLCCAGRRGVSMTTVISEDKAACICHRLLLQGWPLKYGGAPPGRVSDPCGSLFRPPNRVQCPNSTRFAGDQALVAPLLSYHLAPLALLWRCVLWP